MSNKSPRSSPTSKDLLPDSDVHVEHVGDDALHGAELGAQTERQQHHEEGHWPEVGARQLDDGLREDDKRQAGAFRRLREVRGQLRSADSTVPSAAWGRSEVTEGSWWSPEC